MIDMLDHLAKRLGWPLSLLEARIQGRCIRCAKPVTPDVEWRLSSLCNSCFDDLTADPPLAPE